MEKNNHECVGCGLPAPFCIGLVYNQPLGVQEQQSVMLCQECLLEMAQQHDWLLARPIEKEIQSLKNDYMPIEYFAETYTEEECIKHYGPDWRRGFDQVDLDWLDAQERVK